jgi:predicted NodU family carbamoyl transferase
MALAPYGKMDDEIHRRLSELLRITEDGYEVRGIGRTASQTRGFTAYLAVINRIFGPSRTERPSATDPKATNFAFVSQRMLEEAMLSLCRYAKRERRTSRSCSLREERRSTPRPTWSCGSRGRSRA